MEVTSDRTLSPEPSCDCFHKSTTPPSSLRAGAASGDLDEMLAGLRAFAIPMPVRFRGITVREGALIEGPAGWGEFSPFPEYGPK